MFIISTNIQLHQEGIVVVPSNIISMLKAIFCKARGGEGLCSAFSSRFSEMRGNLYIYKKKEEVLRCLNYRRPMRTV